MAGICELEDEEKEGAHTIGAISRAVFKRFILSNESSTNASLNNNNNIMRSENSNAWSKYINEHKQTRALIVNTSMHALQKATLVIVSVLRNLPKQGSHHYHRLFIQKVNTPVNAQYVRLCMLECAKDMPEEEKNAIRAFEMKGVPDAIKSVLMGKEAYYSVVFENVMIPRKPQKQSKVPFPMVAVWCTYQMKEGGDQIGCQYWLSPPDMDISKFALRYFFNERQKLFTSITDSPLSSSCHDLSLSSLLTSEHKSKHVTKMSKEENDENDDGPIHYSIEKVIEGEPGLLWSTGELHFGNGPSAPTLFSRLVQ